MKSLLDNGKYADMTICCQGHEFKGHRAIICSQSSFFDTTMKEGFKEGKSSEVNLPCDDVNTITCVLSFCYLQDYSEADDSMDLRSEEIARNQFRVYLAADKFTILPLRELACSRIIDWAKSNWRSDSFPDIVQLIWRTTPPQENGLRDAIVEVVSANIQHFLTKNGGKNALIENPDFAVEVLEQVATNNNILIQRLNALKVGHLR
ncbi:hypothetical protein BDV33DRAFT_185776 [Aspergillus novoparasiticus]|uniref:BTB domain-containing protein n=1 Tax=Aspergillus novoparasiticus TaxID=986946 RepID=A0A5N6E762_9EURO|nr:hypothetical protein BDV33DRAFT_185776 [Aspergillus novoparasiticus]